MEKNTVPTFRIFSLFAGSAGVDSFRSGTRRVCRRIGTHFADGSERVADGLETDCQREGQKDDGNDGFSALQFHSALSRKACPEWI